MKKIGLLLLFIGIAFAGHAQEMKKVMEDRAREMARVIGLDDKAAWKKFVEENYTKALIEKPMKAQKQGGEGGGQNTTQKGTVEGKVAMYEMMHNDFGDAKISSLKSDGYEVQMILSGSSMSATFTIKFSKDKPWLIDGIGVEAGN